jgi:hypothetical protein
VIVGSTNYDIRVETGTPGAGVAMRAVLDDVPIQCAERKVRVPLDGCRHALLVSNLNPGSPDGGGHRFGVGMDASAGDIATV